MLFWSFFGIISTVAEALCAERQMNVDRFSVMFSTFKFSLADGDISIENKRY